MAKIFIDGKEYEVDEDQNLLHASLSLGLNLPYFCWHPALGSVGACRQCAVKQFKDENDQQGKIVMACMTPVADGTRISIEDPQAREFRASVIEWLMVNHPHDCPICDEGGECHLQDMTVMTGHDYREYSFQKRTYRNQDLGPFINHEMNRCIQCYRCVRFYRDYAGGRDFNSFAAHDHVYFGRYQDGTLENEFSGNLVEVCPTGVFTDKSLKRHYTRKWDLQTAPSVCVNCGLGCDTIPGERYGQLRRIRNRYNHEINGYFLCDRGRYGYEFVNSDQRILHPQLRRSREEQFQPVSKAQALQYVVSLVEKGQRVIGIGSPRASLEANFTLQQLVGADNFYQGMADRENQLVAQAIRIMQDSPARPASLHDIESADGALVLGEDLTNTAPRMALDLRQLDHRKACQVAENFGIPGWNDAAIREVVQDEKEQVFIATPFKTRLDDIARGTLQAAPQDLARLGFAVAHILDPQAPAVEGLAEELQSAAQDIAEMLTAAERPVVISGTSCGSPELLEAAANIALALCKQHQPARLSFTVPEANSLGLGLLGGGSLGTALDELRAGKADVVLILENDLDRRAAPDLVEAALSAARHIIMLDHLATPTGEKADVLLPAGTFAETSGTLVNNEGRAQRFYQVFVPQGEIQESWRWIRDVMLENGEPEAIHWQNLDEMAVALGKANPVFAPVSEIAPPADFRITGQKIPRQSLRYSGRTAMHANIDVNEPKPPSDHDSPLAFSMEGYEGQPPSALIPRFWDPGWNSIQALNKFQSEVNGPLKGGDPGCRLIEPAQEQPADYYKQVPAAYSRRDSQYLLVPVYHIFGSEPLSLLSPGVAARAPQPYLGLGPAQAADLGVESGDELELTVGEQRYRLPARLIAGLAKGLVGVPVGLPGMPHLELPAWYAVSKRIEA